MNEMSELVHTIVKGLAFLVVAIVTLIAIGLVPVLLDINCNLAVISVVGLVTFMAIEYYKM